jgi:hypothetical protein
MSVNNDGFDYLVFEENQRRFPLEELAKHGGKHIAWSLDGSRILASAETIEEVVAQLEAAGIDPHRVMHDYVEDPGVSSLG